MSVTAPPFWHQAPFTRLLFPVVTGIVTCYYLLHGIFTNAQINNTAYVAAGLSIAGLLGTTQLSNFNKYRYHFIQGVFLQIVFASLGVTVMEKTLQARDQETALLAACKNGTVYIMRLIEPLQLKNKTYNILIPSNAKSVANFFVFKLNGNLLFVKKSLGIQVGDSAKIFIVRNREKFAIAKIITKNLLS